LKTAKLQEGLKSATSSDGLQYATAIEYNAHNTSTKN